MIDGVITAVAVEGGRNITSVATQLAYLVEVLEHTFTTHAIQTN